MSLPYIQPDPDELNELMPLSEILGGTSFFSNNGRVYRLFGGEERAFAMPEIPAIPTVLAASTLPAFSLEEALQQIETFSSSPMSGERVEQPQPSQVIRLAEHDCLPTHTPVLQLLRVPVESIVPDRHVEVGIPLKFVKGGSPLPSVALSVKDVVREVSQVLPVTAPKSNKERHQPLRVVSDQVEEPFIVPFAKPVSSPDETETENAAPQIVVKCVQPVLCSKVLRTCGQRRRKEKVLYRRFSLPPVSLLPPVSSLPPVSVAPEPPVIHVQKPPVDTSTFRWSAQLDSLMLTARDQTRMLTDHLVVQQNQGIKGICFKSVFPGDGCSTILLCAVRALLERDYRILLIDAHHRHIDLPQQLNLSGNLDTGNEVITVNEQLGLWVWQESKTVEENSALIAEIVAVHRENYDLILLDDGSVTESPLTTFVEFWSQVELSGVILVSNTKRPSEMPVSHIASRLRQHHIPLIGIAENYV